MVSLPQELRLAMQNSAGEPLRLVDDETQVEYVLLPAATYHQLVEAARFIREFGQAAGWDDPEMDIYNDLDPRRP